VFKTLTLTDISSSFLDVFFDPVQKGKNFCVTNRKPGGARGCGEGNNSKLKENSGFDLT
jgi:hypothetical protein